MNLGDYSLFAKAWLSHDPNDPTMTTDPNFINEPIEEEKTYTDMPDSELFPLVLGVYEIIDSIEIFIENDHENAENLFEAKEFLEEVLADIKASRE